MRKWVSLCCVLVVLLSVAACSSPFNFEEETESASAGRTFVITSQVKQGLEKMSDGVEWQNNALFAVQYVGTREAYQKNMDKIYSARFTQTDQSAFSSMRKFDVGGNEVYLVVPRFDLETISVFSVALDSAEKTHILKQAGESNEAFLLFCRTGAGSPNAEIMVSLADSEKSTTGSVEKMRVVLQKGEQNGELAVPAGLQVLS